MFANSLFNDQKNMLVFIFISQKSYIQMEFTVLNEEQKFIQKLNMVLHEVIKQTECFGFSNILCEHPSLL